MKRNLIAIAVAAALLGLAGCETSPESNATLDQARAAVQDAEADPNVSKYASSELDRARTLLTNAEDTAKQHGANAESAAHYAYLATQMAHIAGQRAHEQVATARIKAGEEERQQILLSAREHEAEAAHDEAHDAQAESQRLTAQLEDMQAAQTSRGIVLTLQDVLFDTGRARLKPGAERSLDRIAAFLNQHPERRIQIEGFTDSEGTNDYNLELSQSRADAVAMAIINRGIDAPRVRATGYGEQYPKASNTNAGSRQLNRRVEIVVSNGEQAVPVRTATGAS